MTTPHGIRRPLTNCARSVCLASPPARIRHERYSKALRESPRRHHIQQQRLEERQDIFRCILFWRLISSAKCRLYTSHELHGGASWLNRFSGRAVSRSSLILKPFPLVAFLAQHLSQVVYQGSARRRRPSCVSRRSFFST